MSNVESDIVINAFDGAVFARETQHPSRAFAFEATIDSARLGDARNHGSTKPPLHFHPHQEEYIEVLEGQMILEIEGREYLLTAGSGELPVLPWARHRIWQPPTPTENGDASHESGSGSIVRFRVSAQETEEVFKLDCISFQNWYGYQDEVVRAGGKLDMIQVLSIFDAGGTYPTLPWWVPFSRTVAYYGTIVVGRWIGGMLGYQPFYHKWTSDWPLACERMQSSFFQKRFASQPIKSS